MTVKQKNPDAVALGRLGGLKGGKAKAEKYTAEERSDQAKKAAAARWAKDSPKCGQSLGNTTKYYKPDRKINLEDNRKRCRDYYTRKKEKAKELKEKGRTIDPFFIKRENPKVWEATYRAAFEEVYGKIN